MVFAIVAMTLALVFYTIGVFGERKVGIIEGKHVLFFLLGLICDSTGTNVMRHLNNSGIVTLKTQIHTITGALALLFMFVHFIWALYVWKKGSLEAKKTFHKFSIVVWVFWLIPYVIGMVIGMAG